jgi:hypothetical protein
MANTINSQQIKSGAVAERQAGGSVSFHTPLWQTFADIRPNSIWP